MNMDIKKSLRDLNGEVLLGIDGMIDEIWELIDSREGQTSYTKMTKLMQLGNAITERGNGGLAKERVPKRRSAGGFCCNTGRATGTMGVKTKLLGTFGENEIDEVFNEIKDKTEMISIGQAVKLFILEFVDGKLFLPHLDELLRLTWEKLVDIVGAEKLKQICNVEIIGVGYWSNMYDFDNIINGFLNISNKEKTKRFFHDFANLNKRTPEALTDALKSLENINSKMPQTLSLNEHEGKILSEHLGFYYPDTTKTKEDFEAVVKSVELIRDAIKIDEVVVHTPYFAVASTAKEGTVGTWQEHCEKPVKTTGAGDTFNGGYIMASLTDLPIKEKLDIANKVTNHYVANGVPPTIEELIEKF